MGKYNMMLGSMEPYAQLESFFGWAFSKGIVFTLLACVALGYWIKGIWGAIIAPSIGLLIFLYLKGSITL